MVRVKRRAMMRIRLAFILGLLCLICAACGKNGDAAAKGGEAPFFIESGGSAFVIATGGLFLRAEASASSAKRAFMPYGESMTVISSGETVETIGAAKGCWLEVEFYGTRGWAFGGFVSARQPPMSTISGRAVGEVYGYDRIGAYNLDSRQFYVIENHARPFIGGIEDPDIGEAELKEISDRIESDNEEACRFAIEGLPAGRYSVYTWAEGNPAGALAYMEKGSYDHDAREDIRVKPAVIEIEEGTQFAGVAFDNNVHFECGGLPGQSEPLPLSESGDFSLVSGSCRTTKPTRLFGLPSDFLTGTAISGGRLLDLEAGAELRADPGRRPLRCGCKTLAPVLDGEGKAWWADAFDLAVGFGLRSREDGRGADPRDAVFILGRSGERWIFRRAGKGMETGSFPADDGDAVPGAALVGAGIRLEAGIDGFSDSGYSGDSGFFSGIAEELDGLDPGAEGLAEFRECLRPYLE